MQRVPQLAVPSEHSQSHFFPLSMQPSTKSPFCGLWLVVFARHHCYSQVYRSYLISYDPLIPLIYSGVGISPPPPVIIGNELEYEVQSIINSRWRNYGRKKRLEYKVQWKNYDKLHDSWEPKNNLSHCADLIEEFHMRHPKSAKL